MHCLYSFRRCPYAMRARLAICLAGLSVELREILLKDKPKDMLIHSSKGTVPVLVLEVKQMLDDSQVIDESLDIMKWAFSISDPKNYLRPHEAFELIEKNDQQFKTHLDNYKYFAGRPQQQNTDLSQTDHRDLACQFIQILEEMLVEQPYLYGDQPCIADIAIFPFIRQFAYVDIKWFESSEYTNVNKWLQHWLNSDLFNKVMHKYQPWQPEDTPTIFGV